MSNMMEDRESSPASFLRSHCYGPLCRQGSGLEFHSRISPSPSRSHHSGSRRRRAARLSTTSSLAASSTKRRLSFQEEEEDSENSSDEEEYVPWTNRHNNKARLACSPAAAPAAAAAAAPLSAAAVSLSTGRQRNLQLQQNNVAARSSKTTTSVKSSLSVTTATTREVTMSASDGKGSPRLKAFDGFSWIRSPRTGYTYVDSATYSDHWTPELEVPMPHMARPPLDNYRLNSVAKRLDFSDDEEEEERETLHPRRRRTMRTGVTRSIITRTLSNTFWSLFLLLRRLLYELPAFITVADTFVLQRATSSAAVDSGVSLRRSSTTSSWYRKIFVSVFSSLQSGVCFTFIQCQYLSRLAYRGITSQWIAMSGTAAPTQHQVRRKSVVRSGVDAVIEITEYLKVTTYRYINSWTTIRSASNGVVAAAAVTGAPRGGGQQDLATVANGEPPRGIVLIEYWEHLKRTIIRSFNTWTTILVPQPPPPPATTNKRRTVHSERHVVTTLNARHEDQMSGDKEDGRVFTLSGLCCKWLLPLFIALLLLFLVYSLLDPQPVHQFLEENGLLEVSNALSRTADYVKSGIVNLFVWVDFPGWINFGANQISSAASYASSQALNWTYWTVGSANTVIVSLANATSDSVTRGVEVLQQQTTGLGNNLIDVSVSMCKWTINFWSWCWMQATEFLSSSEFWLFNTGSLIWSVLIDSLAELSSWVGVCCTTAFSSASDLATVSAEVVSSSYLFIVGTIASLPSYLVPKPSSTRSDDEDLIAIAKPNIVSQLNDYDFQRIIDAIAKEEISSLRLEMSQKIQSVREDLLSDLSRKNEKLWQTQEERLFGNIDSVHKSILQELAKMELQQSAERPEEEGGNLSEDFMTRLQQLNITLASLELRAQQLEIQAKLCCNWTALTQVDVNTDLLQAYLMKHFVQTKDLNQTMADLSVSLLQEAIRGQKLAFEEALLSERKIWQQEWQSNVTLDYATDHHPRLEEVRQLVMATLLQYDADKTGQFDYALETAGGSVVSTRCTETFEGGKSAAYTLFGIPLWYPFNNPRTAIQPGVQPGECWPFKGSRGYLVVQLSRPIRPTRFSMEHIPKSLSPNGKIDSAPKDFEVFGLQFEKDPDKQLLGSYKYDDGGSPVQFFPVNPSVAAETAFSHVELVIASNHGNVNYTCLYRFRVHGNP